MPSTLVVTRRSELREALATARGRIGFVPTLGALHKGHASLLRAARARCDGIHSEGANPTGVRGTTVLSIFVNPKQFGANDDFSKYPRTFQADLDIARAESVDIVFAPTAQEMYPNGFCTNVRVAGMDEVLEGRFRAGHFEGVCTVVLLLLNLVGAHEAYFGQKDLQQVCILDRLCADLAHPTRIVPCPTVRDADGLALSSRNRYLSAGERVLASAIPRALGEAASAFLNSGERDAQALVETARTVLTAAGLSPQYLEIRATGTLAEVNGSLEEAFARGEHAALAVAQLVGSTRLIDNIVFGKAAAELAELASLAELVRPAGGIRT